MKKNIKISIIGSGNVAFHLAKAFYLQKVNITHIYSRNKIEGKILAKNVNAIYSDNIEDTVAETDVYIMAVSDDAIAKLAKKISLGDKILVHTSGIADTNVLKFATKNYACFYPLQTFTKNIEISDYKKIPILINASNKQTENILIKLAKNISNKVELISDNERQKLHLSAVVVNNFVNHLFTLSSEYLNENNLDFDLLKPLIAETIEKIYSNKPFDIQTGPAKRNDTKTIEKHLSLIENKNLKDVYEAITKSIFKTYNA